MTKSSGPIVSLMALNAIVTLLTEGIWRTNDYVNALGLVNIVVIIRFYEVSETSII